MLIRLLRCPELWIIAAVFLGLSVSMILGSVIGADHPVDMFKANLFLIALILFPQFLDIVSDLTDEIKEEIKREKSSMRRLPLCA